MKKLVLIFIFMILNINGLIKDLHAEFSHVNNNEQFSEIIDEVNSIKKLLDDKHMTEIIHLVNDSMLIDKIKIFEYKKFLAKKETGNASNPYGIVNRYGYAGKYQFGKSALRTLHNFNLIEFDIDKEGRKAFLMDSVIQEKALNALLVYHLNYAKNKNLFKYVGKKYHGTVVTTEGILASSHLVGITAVRHFLENDGSLDDFYIQGKRCRKYDGNGVSLVNYMKIFENV